MLAQGILDLVQLTPPSGGVRGVDLDANALICVSGRVEVCPALLAMDEAQRVEAVALPQAFYQRRDVGTWMHTGRPQGGVFRVGQMTFDRLEEEFGTEAFRKFWRSRKPVAIAFEDAFDIEPGLWMMSWAQGQSGALEAGPALDFEDIGLSILTIFSMLAIAIQVARNRTA